jgi:superfamily II DNA or RNA helicase
MKLRPYQLECKQAVLHDWRELQRLLIVLATGTGKTVIMSDLMGGLDGKILFLAHTRLLVQQFSVKFGMATGRSARCLIGGQWNDVNSDIHAAVLDSAVKGLDTDYDYIFIDEAHRAMADGYLSILDNYPNAKVLGVTATPDRGDKKDLGRIFEKVSYEYLLDRAIKEGYCCSILCRTIPLSEA